MPANITINEFGFAECAFSNYGAWHNLGTIIDHDMNSKEAIEASGLGWSVIQKPMAYRVETPEGPSYHDLVEDVSGDDTRGKGLYGNLRADNGLFLGTVSNQYQIVQNREAFQFMDELVENHEMKYESCFSLSDGKTVVLLGQLPKVDYVVQNDPLLRFILMKLSHDGSSGIHFGPTSVRAVCENTMRLAIYRDGKNMKELSIRHTGNIHDKLQEARQILSLVNEQFEAHTHIAQELAQKKLTIQEWERFLDIVCPRVDEADSSVSTRTKNKVEELRGQMSDAYLLGENQSLPGIEKSAWSAYNAITEVIEHHPRRGSNERMRSEARFNVLLYGSGHTHKQHALETICNLAGVDYSLSS